MCLSQIFRQAKNCTVSTAAENKKTEQPHQDRHTHTMAADGVVEVLQAAVSDTWLWAGSMSTIVQDVPAEACRYYEDAVGEGACGDLTHAVHTTQHALMAWVRVLVTLAWALALFLYENPLVLAALAGLVLLYIATRLMVRATRRLMALVRRYVRLAMGRAERAAAAYRRFLDRVRRQSRVVAALLPPISFFVVWGYALTFDTVLRFMDWPFAADVLARVWPTCMSIAAIVQIEDIVPAPTQLDSSAAKGALAAAAPPPATPPPSARHQQVHQQPDAANRGRRSMLASLFSRSGTTDTDADNTHHASNGNDNGNGAVFQSPHSRRLRIPTPSHGRISTRNHSHSPTTTSSSGGSSGVRRRVATHHRSHNDGHTTSHTTAAAEAGRVDVVVRWLEYWVCFGVLTTCSRVPVLSSTAYALLPYAHVAHMTLLLWLVAPLIGGTRIVFSLLRNHVFTTAVASPASRRFQHVLAAYVTPLWAVAKMVVPTRVQRVLMALSALFTDTSVFLIALPAVFSPRFLTRFAAVLVAYMYPAYKTTCALSHADLALDAARAVDAADAADADGRTVGGDSDDDGHVHSRRRDRQDGRGSDITTATTTARHDRVVGATNVLLGWLKYWVVLVVFEVVWAGLTRVTHDSVPLWWDLHIGVVMLLQLPALGAAAFLFDDFRVSPTHALRRLGNIAASLLSPWSLRASVGGDVGAAHALNDDVDDDDDEHDDDETAIVDEAAAGVGYARGSRGVETHDKNA
ncbi:hypothetical protein PTSG_11231 [Salpingoeca rosetta]|uniref:Uncharacterized protein n=1 Tax=Salpingoeca rosetta (strain ATCC 50818 / BSB-021) TaxID=946362 RepID=F2UST6_SALR5|nr:uncharacterized protein PTSG_11231 [Salpingoeca rosetta]EGD81195.1 hypothetical protein PTSG_11231 [Salpingoeca rosetta]|eukprot:XP_004987730.1 hypothetical protein PTSG_11231 [Salpingoeca rosetta]